ncbi:MAG: hypothetical protein SGJ10_03955 [Bacteroidota bacterium]|nr:hypothetical protein [Bacteroidota bacterium]
MKKVILSILTVIICHTSSVAQSFYKLMGEHDGKTVKLMWLIYKWDKNAIGVDIKKRVGKGSWTTVNTTEIIPSFGNDKDLSYADNDIQRQNELNKKAAALIASGKFKPVSSTDYIKKLKTDSSTMLSLTFLFVNDFDLAVLNGFGLTDKDVPSGEVEYGLFFHGINADEPLATYAFTSGKPSLSSVDYTLKFKPNLSKTALNIYYDIDLLVAQKSNYNGFNIYKKNEDGNWHKLTSSPIWFNTLYKTKEHFYLDQKVNKDSNYIYSLVSVSIFGTEGGKIEHLYNPRKFAGTILPSTIAENKKITDGDGLGLTWTFDIAQESFIKGFVVQRKPHIDSAFADISSIIPANERNYKDITNKLYNNYHFYRIKIVPHDDQSLDNILGKELLIYYRPELKPNIPQGLQAQFISEAGKRYIYLKWDKNTDRFTKGYRIYASFPPSTKLSWQGDIPLVLENEYKYPVSNFESSDYHLSISAISELEDESKLSNIVIVTSPSSYMPNVQIWPFKVDSNQITLEWKYNITKDLKGFRIYADGKLLADENSLTADSRKYILKSLEYNATYNYEIEAVSKNNVISKRSNAVSILTDKKKKK